MSVFGKAETTPRNAIDLLTADHQRVSELFAQYERTSALDPTSGEKPGIAVSICIELTVHAQLEEEIFYPACRGAMPEMADLLAEAKVEHQSLGDLIDRIGQEEPDTEEFDAQVKVLAEYVKHHVKEEQEEIFPRVKRSSIDIEALGDQIAARKREITEAFVNPILAESDRPNG